MSDEDRTTTQEIPATYTIQCYDCRKRFWLDGMDVFTSATQWPKTEARYSLWSVGLRNYCPKCVKRREETG